MDVAKFLVVAGLKTFEDTKSIGCKQETTKIFGSWHQHTPIRSYLQTSMDTSNEHSESPLSTDAESQSHYTFSPLEHRKLSMLSGESDFEDVEVEDCGIAVKEDARSKHLWEEISDFKEKTDILQKKDYDLRWAYKQRDGANVFKCILHHNCEVLVRIRCEGNISHHIFLRSTNNDRKMQRISATA
jgi:hypothetical protein